MDTDSAIAALYDAAEDESLWPEALRRVAAASGALGGSLYAMDERANIGWNASHAIDPKILARYSGHYASIDLKMIRSHRNPNRLNVEGLTQPRPAWYEGSEVDFEVYRPAGVKYSASVILQADDGASWIFTHHRARDRGEFTPRDIRVYEGLATHAVRALRLDLVRRREVGRAGALAAALDRMATAVLLLAPDGRVVEANAAGRALLDGRAGLRLVQGRLHADEPGTRRALAALVATCGRRVGGDGLPHAGGALAVPRPHGRPLHLRLVPLGIGGSAAHPRAASCLALVTDPDSAAAPGADTIARLHGLTPSEARVAALIAEGLAPAAVAERLALRTDTVRTYLKRVMAKVGVARQSELVRVLNAVPAVRRDG